MGFKWRDNCTEEFLNLYRSYEYLWNNLNPLYKNRIARVAAYKEIIERLNVPNLTIRDVKKKIKTIRTNYKYELNKVLRSQKDAVDPSDVYVPHLFWFKKADEFLRDFSMGRECNSSKMEYSEDEDYNEYTQSEDNTHFQSMHEGFGIKLEDQSMQDEEISTEGKHSDNHSISHSPPAATIHESNPMNEVHSISTENQNGATGPLPIRLSPSTTSDIQKCTPPLPAFKAPISAQKTNGRQYRKYGTMHSYPKPRFDPINRSRQLFQLEEKINSLQKSVDSLKNDEDDEFDLFGKSIALQLKKMPLERALACQESLQRVINQERLSQNKLSTNSFGT